MKKINLFLLTIIIKIIVASSSFAQDPNALKLPNYLPPSPQAANFLRYGEIPVGHSTGIPQIEIPIYTIKAGDYNFPITLSYHAGGNKVRDIASIVGLGWVLNAGGVVSRTAMGVVDNLSPSQPGNQRFFLKNKNDVETYKSQYTDYYMFWETLIFNKYHQKEYDTMSDKYSYSFNGQSGTFRFDSETGTLKTVPYVPFQIETGETMSITDEKGIKYIFAQPEKTRATPMSPGSQQWETTSWYLTSIKFPGIDDDIIITYKKGQEYTNFSMSQTLNWSPSYEPQSFQCLLLSRDYGLSEADAATISECVLIDKITWRNTAIQFSYMEDRKDRRKERLSQILIDNGTGTIKSVELHNNSTFWDARRLKLDSVVSKGDGTLPSSKEVYSFKYWTHTNLPTDSKMDGELFFKFHEDYWGYYNGTSSLGSIPEDFVRPIIDDIGASGLYQNYYTNRNPNEYYMKAGVLTEIAYPTGGRTEFEYEANEATRGYYYNQDTAIVGGLRVKKITSYIGTDALSPQVKSFEYGVPQATHMINDTDFYYTDTEYTCTDNCGDALYSKICSEEFYTINNSPVYPLIAFGSTPVFYENIKEYSGTKANNNGWVEYNYIPSTVTKTNCNIYNGQYAYFSPDEDCDQGHVQPLLRKKAVYSREGILQDFLENKYIVKELPPFRTGVRITNRTRYSPGYDGIASRFALPYKMHLFFGDMIYYETWAYPSTYLLDSTIRRENQEKIELKTNYTYDEQLRIREPVSTSFISSGNKKVTVKNFYTFDKTGQPYTDMVAKNILATVTETNRYSDNLLTDKLVYNYGAYSSSNSVFYRPSSVERNSVMERIYNAYDNKFGNTLQYTIKGVTPVSYIWSYNGEYPIAEVKNAQLTEVAFANFENVYEYFPAATPVREWSVPGYPPNPYASIWFSSDSYTGNVSCKAPSLSSKIVPNADYIIFFYAKGNGMLTINGTNYVTTGIWNSYSIPLSGITSVSISNPNAVMIDDLRLYPLGAEMTTYTYKPLVGMTSSTDSRGQTTYYEYDNFQRLKTVKDANGKVLKSYDYHYKP